MKCKFCGDVIDDLIVKEIIVNRVICHFKDNKLHLGKPVTKSVKKFLCKNCNHCLTKSERTAKKWTQHNEKKIQKDENYL